MPKVSASQWSELAEAIGWTITRLIVLTEGDEAWYPVADLLGKAHTAVEKHANELGAGA